MTKQRSLHAYESHSTYRWAPFSESCRPVTVDRRVPLVAFKQPFLLT